MFHGEFYEDGSYKKGRMEFPNGSTYEGEYDSNAKRYGYGKMSMVKGNKSIQTWIDANQGKWNDDRYVVEGWFEKDKFAYPCNSPHDCKQIAAQKEVQEKERNAEAAKLHALGRCEIGETVISRELVGISSSSGNPLADVLWSSHTKAQYVIEYEAVVEGFVGNKVKTIINGYSVKQLSKGNYVDASDARSSVSNTADKLVGKVQFYDRSRCSK